MSFFASIRAFIEDRPWAFMFGTVAVVTAIRILLLFLSRTDLGPDEAQYWFWSREFDFGYYSKPPMIAWVIGLGTMLIGSMEAGVRLFSPLLIGGAALFLFAAGRRLYGDRVGVWTGMLWLTLPVVIFGATIISSDVPLLFFWCWALFALVGMAEARGRASYGWAMLLGTAIGLGMLSKYAMIYFVIGWALALLVSPYLRRGTRVGPMLLAVGIAGLIFAPNILWNLEHGLQTLKHTADNANLGESLVHPEELGDFLSAQFGVFGPLLFIALVLGFFTLPRRLKEAGPERGKDFLLLAFILPPLVIICVQAFLSRAHANWAVAAYPAACILLPVWLGRVKARWILWTSLGIHIAAGILLSVLTVRMDIADRMGLSNAVKRLRGWEEQARQIREAARGLDAVILDEREFAAHLVWEWRDDPMPIMVADLNARIDNTYEQAFPFDPVAEGAYLLATQQTALDELYPMFCERTPRGESFVDLHAERRGRRERTVDLYILSAYRPAGDC